MAFRRSCSCKEIRLHGTQMTYTRLSGEVSPCGMVAKGFLGNAFGSPKVRPQDSGDAPMVSLFPRIRRAKAPGITLETENAGCPQRQSWSQGERSWRKEAEPSLLPALDDEQEFAGKHALCGGVVVGYVPNP
jgi:hypothetical protein